MKKQEQHIRMILPAHEAMKDAKATEEKAPLPQEAMKTPGRRRALVGRPAGTECGNSCTCS